MKIIIQIVLTVLILAVGIYLGQDLWQQQAKKKAAEEGHAHGHGSTGMDVHNAETDMGPHGGRLLKQGDLRLEIMVYESGVSPEFRIYAWYGDKLIQPGSYDLKVELHRLGGDIDRFTFDAREEYKVSNETVDEPHSFDVKVSAGYSGRDYAWSYEQHEGRVTIPQEMAEAAGIRTARAGKAEISETLNLQGRVKYDRSRLRQVRARFPGVIHSAPKTVGDKAAAGEVLARVESNDSLQVYEVRAPMSGVIVEQQTGSGEAIDNQPIYSIANLTKVWVDMAVFPRDWARIATGQSVHIQSLSNGQKTTTEIDYLLPTSDAYSQIGTARIYLDNENGHWRPGMAITATVTINKTEVPLAVRNSALQTFRGFDVVYARYGNTYEVRMLELGQQDTEHTEVLGGIDPGTEYVVENSYLIKADIEKSGAAHAH